mgnify:CR=1 FL=1
MHAASGTDVHPIWMVTGRKRKTTIQEIDPCRNTARPDNKWAVCFPKYRRELLHSFAKRKNMKNSKFTLLRRSFAIVAVVVLLLTALSSCGGKAQVVKPTVNGDVFLSMDEGTTLTATELKAIAAMLSATYATDFDTQEMLIAAYRGYDMLAEDFNPKADAPQKDPDLTALRELIVKANDSAKVEDKIPLKAADATEEQTNGIDLDQLNDRDLLTLVEATQLEADLTKSSGVVDKILGVIGMFLGWLTNTLCFGSYIAGICVFAIIIELLMLPFSIKQQKNSIKQANLRPKEMAIKNKYKGRNDQPTMQKMQSEIQDLYQRENFSPYSGCLPLLLQMPIVMALYYIVIDPLHYVLGQAANVTTALTTFATASPAAGGLGMTVASNRGTIELFGEKAGAKIDPELKLFSETNGYMTDVTLRYPTALSFDGLFQKEIDHYVDCLLGKCECRSPAEDGYELMRILDAAYESARTGHEVIL